VTAHSTDRAHVQSPINTRGEPAGVITRSPNNVAADPIAPGGIR